MERLEKDAERTALRRAHMSVEAKGSNHEQDRQRKQIERSNEHTSDREARLLADSTRHLEMRAQETADEHESRILTQRTRQQYLRSKETAGKIKERQQIDASSKVFKRAAKADAFEKSFEPRRISGSNLPHNYVKSASDTYVVLYHHNNKRVS